MWFSVHKRCYILLFNEIFLQKHKRNKSQGSGAYMDLDEMEMEKRTKQYESVEHSQVTFFSQILKTNLNRKLIWMILSHASQNCRYRL